VVSKQREPSTAAGRWARGWRLDRNPLRRASDRTETFVLVLLFVAFLVGAPLAALGSSAWAHTLAQRDLHAQLASRYLVTAVTTVAPASQSGSLVSAARARWTAPDGKVVTDELAVPDGSKTGTPVQIWTTDDGKVTTQPMNASGVGSLTVLGGVAGVIAFAALLTLSGALARWSIDRRRMAAWDSDWRMMGPRWTTRA
jgi:hypothetical protein